MYQYWIDSDAFYYTNDGDPTPNAVMTPLFDYKEYFGIVTPHNPKH